MLTNGLIVIIVGNYTRDVEKKLGFLSKKNA
jgi:hypothetical protein